MLLETKVIGNSWALEPMASSMGLERLLLLYSGGCGSSNNGSSSGRSSESCMLLAGWRHNGRHRGAVVLAKLW